MKVDYLKFTEEQKELIREHYPTIGTKLIEKFNLDFKVKEVRAMAKALGVRKIVRRWTLIEDKVACKFYLKGKKAEQANKLLKRIGIEPRTLSCMKAKIRNYKYLDTGVGYYGYSNQAKEVYIDMTGNIHPYTKPKRKKKGGWY